MSIDAIAPVRKSVRVRMTPARAFELFTRELARWWPLARYSCSGDANATVEFEGAGGRVIETARDGTRHVWGTLLEWNPPQSFAMTWHPTQPAEQATRVDVRFVPADGWTEIQFAHSGWEARGAQAFTARETYERGWTSVLEQYVAYAREVA